MFGASFITNTRDESRFLCQSFGRLLCAVGDVMDSNSNPVNVLVSGRGNTGKTSVADFSIEGIHANPVQIFNVGVSDFRVCEIFSGANGSNQNNPVCMLSIYHGLYDAFLAVKGTIRSNANLSMYTVSVGQIEEVERYLQYYFRFGSEYSEEDIDLDIEEHGVSKLADIMFCTVTTDVLMLEPRASVYFHVETPLADDIWKGRVSNIAFTDNSRFVTPEFQDNWDVFLDSPFFLDLDKQVDCSYEYP